MLIGELCQRIGRSSDTVKRWEDLGLIDPSRDSRHRRVFTEADVICCMRLAKLGILAMVRGRKIAELATVDTLQLSFDFSPLEESGAA